MNQSDPLAWTPRHGETVHYRAIAARGLPTGRYQLDKQPGEFNGSFWLRGVTNGRTGAMSAGELAELERTGRVTPISSAELARERQEVQLRAAAPLRQRRDRDHRPQHDASDLALFRAANEPGLL